MLPDFKACYQAIVIKQHSTGLQIDILTSGTQQRDQIQTDPSVVKLSMSKIMSKTFKEIVSSGKHGRRIMYPQ